MLLVDGLGDVLQLRGELLCSRLGRRHQVGVAVALDLLGQNATKLSLMQRFKRIKLSGQAAMLLVKIRRPSFGLLERDRRDFVLDDLLPGQRDDADLGPRR